VFYVGGARGAYRQMMNKVLRVEKGSLMSPNTIDASTSIYAFKPQARIVRTEDANQKTVDDEQSSCGVESADQDNIDRSFQLLIVGHGPATLRWVRPFAFLVPEDMSGDATACDEETGIKAVRFDGVGTTQDTYGEAADELAARAVFDYTAHKTAILEADDFIAVGVGSAQSIVSQAAADRVAEIIATKMAENELSVLRPLITSIGEGFV
jgi:hypothetical protein